MHSSRTHCFAWHKHRQSLAFVYYFCVLIPAFPLKKTKCENTNCSHDALKLRDNPKTQLHRFGNNPSTDSGDPEPSNIQNSPTRIALI